MHFKMCTFGILAWLKLSQLDLILISKKQYKRCDRWKESVWGIRPVAWPRHSRGAATPHWACSGPSLWWRLWSPCWSAAWLHTAEGRRAHPLFPAERSTQVESNITGVAILYNQACLITLLSLFLFCPHLEVAVHADGHPVSQHFLHNRLSAAQHQFGVLGSRSIN